MMITSISRLRQVRLVIFSENDVTGIFNVLNAAYENVTLQSNKEHRVQVKETREQGIVKPRGQVVEQVVMEGQVVVVAAKIREEEKAMEERETALKKKKRKRKHLLQVEAVDSM